MKVCLAIATIYVLVMMAIALPLPADHWFNSAWLWGRGMAPGFIAAPVIWLVFKGAEIKL